MARCWPTCSTAPARRSPSTASSSLARVNPGFVIGRRLKGPDCTIFDVLNATDYIIPAAEIVDG